MITLNTLNLAAEIVKKGTKAENLVRVPPRLFQAHPKAYIPLFVSLGPFHHIGRYSAQDQDGKTRFKDVNLLASETKKQACMLQFISSKKLIDPFFRYGTGGCNPENPPAPDLEDHSVTVTGTHNPPDSSEIVSHTNTPIEQELLGKCQQFVRENLHEIWSVYCEEVQISVETLANIILVDSCFLLGFLAHGPKDIMFSAFRRDLALLENQIPFFVLVGLSKILGKFSGQHHLSMLILQTFKLCPAYPPSHTYDSSPIDLKRYVDMLPCINDMTARLRDMNFGSDCIHLLDFIRLYHTLNIEHTVPIKIDGSRAIHLRNATELSACGLTFECTQGVHSHSVLNLSFSKGVLSIPPLLVSDYTETLLISLLAHEHLSPNLRGHFTSYVFFMSQLVGSKEDLQFLEKKGIIHNELGSREDVSKLFSNISKQFVLKDFLYSKLCNEIEAYADSTWQRHLQVLKERYFSNPWTALSVFAATVLLLLTFMQTYYTVLSYYKGPHPK